MNRMAVWIATAVLLVAAGVVSQIAPAEDAEVAPFVVAGAPGEQLTGRDISATATDARFVDLLEDSSGWSADGVWFVIDLDVLAVTGPAIATLDGVSSLRGATLVVDGRSFRATERTDDSLLGARLFPGVARSGALAFELAARPAPGSILVLQLSADADTRADSVLEISFAADDLAEVPEFTMTETGWAS